MRSEPVPYDDSRRDVDAPLAGFGRRAGAFLLHEFLEMLPPTIFFFIGFNLIVLTTNLILADYSVAFCRLYPRDNRGTCRRQIGAGRQRDGGAPPLRPRASDQAHSVQDSLLLGHRIHRAAPRTLPPVLADRAPSGERVSAAHGRDLFRGIALPRSRSGFWFCF
jgi:hypothetical protein